MKIRDFLAFFFVCFLTFTTFSQVDNVIYKTRTTHVDVGQIFLTRKMINGTIYNFKNSLKSISTIDDEYLLLSFKNKHYSFHPVTGLVEYEIEAPHNLLYSDSSFIYKIEKGNFELFDKKNGTNTNTISGTLKFLDSNTGLGIFKDNFNENKYHVHNINQFFELSSFESKIKEPINEIIKLPSGKLLLNWGGMTLLDENKNILWSYEQKSKKTYSEKIIFEIFAAAATTAASFGLAAGASNLRIFYTPTLYNDPYILYKLHSNIVSNKDNFYRASFERIDCIDTLGQQIWSTPLSTTYESTSKLFQFGEKLILLNTGTAINNNSTIYYGETCLSTFDIKTGKQIGFNKLQASHNTKINDFKVNGNELIALQNNGISAFNLESGVKFKHKASTELKSYNLKYFSADKYYLNGAKTMIPWKEDEDQYCINYGSDKLLLLNQDFKVIKKEQIKNLCCKIGQYQNYEIILCENLIYFVSEGQKIAMFNKGDAHQIVGKSFIISKDDNLFVVDLSFLEL